ncbi:MAG TPA: HNH endonuclease [Ruminococcaceae bacterium]|jgi:5-methylcytosine-specific restriction endonuclease McrA|nr:HNH endonuclease [Oscillospiraceae bacterium]HCM24096.1 HNH endonuclease [Oscillospiraceae bacterium]
MKTYRTYTPAQLSVWIPQLVARNDMHAFYISHAWLHLREQVLREQHYECQLCKARGLYVPATTVHHIQTVRHAPWLALTKSNLLAVCDECHYKIHHKQNKKWEDERW